jgi:hypothetical protein
MNMQSNKVVNGPSDIDSETTVRPLARLLAKELSAEEIELISAGCGKCTGATNDTSSDNGDPDYLK